MNDTQFITHFEQAHLPQFTHRDHIHMAWIYLRVKGWDEGCRVIRNGLKHFALAHGQADKYHETITMFWAHLVEYHRLQSPDIDDFDTFVDSYPLLLDKTLLNRHYSHETLASLDARTDYIQPDLVPMP